MDPREHENQQQQVTFLCFATVSTGTFRCDILVLHAPVSGIHEDELRKCWTFSSRFPLAHRKRNVQILNLTDVHVQTSDRSRMSALDGSVLTTRIVLDIACVIFL